MVKRIESYLEANRLRIPPKANWENYRFACLDSECTGLDPKKDRIISIAGVGLKEDEIFLDDQFSVIVPIAYNTSSVTVHGITREAAADGVEEPEAIRRFLEWLQDGIIVGHHIQHDITLLNLACERHFNLEMKNKAIDTMEAFLAVHEAGGFTRKPIPEGYSLDALCDCFGIVAHDRHTALGDAFLTAQILLRILKEARKLGLWNLDDLHAWSADEPFPHAQG
jgi:DNA polymerase-3 subunit epsilon